MDSLQPVTFKFPHQIGEGTSAAAATQAAQVPSTSATGTTKGKEIMDAEKEVVTEQPTSSMEQPQVQAPLQQTEAPIVPAL